MEKVVPLSDNKVLALLPLSCLACIRTNARTRCSKFWQVFGRLCRELGNVSCYLVAVSAFGHCT